MACIITQKYEYHSNYFIICRDIKNGIHPLYNRSNICNGSAWWEDIDGIIYKDKNEMREQKLKQLGI